MGTIVTEITIRIGIITLIYSIISYIIIQKHSATPEQLATAIPLFFAAFGVVN